jgi:hypothetical protein
MIPETDSCFDESDFSSSNTLLAYDFEMTNADGSATVNTTVPRTERKRGRKAMRPNLRGKKTEDLDKYWIRRFRGYTRKNPEILQK